MRQKSIVLGLVLGAAFLTLSCGGSKGVPQGDYDALKKELDEIKAQQQASQPLVFANLVSTPTPAATNTPAPAGQAAPVSTPRTPPPSTYDPVGPFFFYVETLTSNAITAYGLQASPGCVPEGVFKRGMRIVWRFEIFDAATGKRLTDRDTGARVTLKIPNQPDITARFAVRGGSRAPETAPWTWVATWDIPLDYALGALDYSIVVTTADGRTATFKPPALINPATNTDTRVRII